MKAYGYKKDDEELISCKRFLYNVALGNWLK